MGLRLTLRGSPTVLVVARPLILATTALMAVVATAAVSNDPLLRGEQLYRRALQSRRTVEAEEAAQLLVQVAHHNAGCHPSQADGGCAHRRSKANFYLGASLQLLGRADEALEAFHLSARQSATGRPAVWENMAALHATRKDWGAAAAAAGKAASLRPRDASLAGEHGKLLFRAGDVGKGQAVLGGAAHAAALVSRPRDKARWLYELARSQELFGMECGARHTSVNVNSNFTAAQRAAAAAWALEHTRALTLAAPGTTHLADRDASGCRDPSLTHGWTAPSPGGSGALRAVEVLGRHTGQFTYELASNQTALPRCWAPQRYEEREIVRVTLENVTLAGNDALIVDRACNIYLPHIGVQVPLHRNLPPPLGPPGGKHPPAPVRLASAILAVQVFSVGFYHFLLDVLPRLLLAAAARPLDPILVAADDGLLHGFMARILELVRLGDRVVPYNVLPVARHPTGVDPRATAARFSVGRLTYVDWRPATTVADGGRDDTQHLPPARALRLVRDTLAPRRPVQTAGRARPTVVFVQRAKAATRRLMREESVIAQVREALPANWRLLVYSDAAAVPLSLEATIGLFHAAHVVVGVHGAGLANAVFCAPGSAVVEVTIQQPHGQYYAHLAAALQLGYWQTPAASPHAYAEVAVEVDAEKLATSVREAVQWSASHRGRVVRLPHGL